MPPEELQGAASGPRKALVHRETAFETTLMVGGLFLFLMLLFEMRTAPGEKHFLNPPLIAAAGTILLWPLRRQANVRSLLLAGGFLMLIWFASRLGDVLALFAFIYLLAYLFDPLLEAARERFRIPRSLSAMAVTLLVVGAFALLILLLAPKVLGQLEDLAARIFGSAAHLNQWLQHAPILDQIEKSGIIKKQALIDQLTASLEAQAGQAGAVIPRVVQRVLGVAGSVIGLITTLALIPVILYYTLKDYPFITRRLVELFPTFGGDREYLSKAGDVVGNYLRGQIIISAIAAFNVSVVLVLFDVPFALLIGLLTGLLNMIPNLGAIITNVIGISIAAVFGDPWFIDALIVFATLLGQSILESAVLTPKILSSHVGLHPVLILLSLLAFGYLMGLFGLLIAVPVTALAMTFYKAYRSQLTLELGEPEGPPPRRRPAAASWPFGRRRRGGQGRVAPEAPDQDGTGVSSALPSD